MSTSSRDALLAGLRRLAKTPLGKAANAALVGAKTVNGPGPDKIFTRSPAFNAVTSVDRDGVANAKSTMVLPALAAVMRESARSLNRTNMVVSTTNGHSNKVNVERGSVVRLKIVVSVFGLICSIFY